MWNYLHQIEFNYSILGPFATYKDDKDQRTFEFGWNVKFEKGKVYQASFRVEHPSELYHVMSHDGMSSKDIGNGIQRIEQNFKERAADSFMSINLKGIVSISTVELYTPKSMSISIIIAAIVLSVFFMFIFVKKRVNRQFVIPFFLNRKITKAGRGVH